LGLFSLLGKSAVPFSETATSLKIDQSTNAGGECRWASFLAPASSANQIGNSAVPFNANNAVKLNV
jgi:hypothetical protein